MDKITQFKELAQKDCEEYKKRRKSFYANPVHWSNNKRRGHGLPTLRGNANKCRSKVFHSYYISPETFNLMEDILCDAICCGIAGESYFDKFVTTKDLNVGDCDVFHIE